MPLDNRTSELVLEEVFKWTCLARRREEEEYTAIDARRSELFEEYRAADPWCPTTTTRYREAEQKYVNYELLCRERSTCRRVLQFYDTVLRRVVNHSTLAVVQQLPSLLDPWNRSLVTNPL